MFQGFPRVWRLFLEASVTAGFMLARNGLGWASAPKITV
jgi:hypothetical protein